MLSNSGAREDSRESLGLEGLQGMTEDEMAREHRQLNEHELRETVKDSVACAVVRSIAKSKTWRSNWTTTKINLKRRVYDNDYMWPTKSNMFPVWPFMEKKGPDVLFITLPCLRTSFSSRSGSTLLSLLRWASLVHFPASSPPWACGLCGPQVPPVPGWVQTQGVWQAVRGQERGEAGVSIHSCVLSTASGRHVPQPEGTAPFEAADLYLLSSGVWDLLALSPWAKAISTPTSLWFYTFCPRLSKHLFTEDSAPHPPPMGPLADTPTNVTVVGQEGTETRNRKRPRDQLCFLIHKRTWSSYKRLFIMTVAGGKTDITF